MTNLVVVQQAAEVLCSPVPNLHLVQQAAEVLRKPIPSLQVASQVVEVLRFNDYVAPMLDGQITGTWSGGSTTTLTLSTTKTSDLIVVVVAYEQSSVQRNIVGVTSSHLTFSKRKQYAPSQYAKCTLEVWTAIAATALSSEVITITLDGGIDDGAACAFAVSGTNTAAPFDSNASLPYCGYATGSPTITFSTTQGTDFVFVVQASAYGGSTPTAPAGWVQLAAFINNGGGLYQSLGIFYQIATGPVTAQSVTCGGASYMPYVALVDALTNAPSTGGGGGGGGASTVPQSFMMY